MPDELGKWSRGGIPLVQKCIRKKTEHFYPWLKIFKFSCFIPFRRLEVIFVLSVTSPLSMAWLLSIHPSIYLRHLVHLTLQYHKQDTHLHTVSTSLFSLFFLQVHAFTSFSNVFVLPTPSLLRALSDTGTQLLYFTDSYCKSHVSHKNPSSDYSHHSLT